MTLFLLSSDNHLPSQSLSLSHHHHHYNDAVSLANPLVSNESPDNEVVVVDNWIDELDDDVVLEDSSRDDELLGDATSNTVSTRIALGILASSTIT